MWGDKILTIKQYIRWVIVVILREFVLPFLGKPEWEECGRMELHYADNKKEWDEANLICFKLKGENIYRIWSPWKYWKHYMTISYLIMLVEIGVWTWDEFCDFMTEDLEEA